MKIIFMLLITGAALAAAAYAHYRIPYHTTHQRRAFAHLTLIIVGCAFGWVTTQRYMATGFIEALIFLSAFGAIHIPAAAILFIKSQGKAGKS